MLDTVWTFMSISNMSIAEFVQIVQTSMSIHFAKYDSDVQDIFSYIADCPAVGEATQPIPAFASDGVQLVNEVLTASVKEVIARRF